MAFKHVITGRVKPIDRFGMPHSFPEDKNGHLIMDINLHYWFLTKETIAAKTEGIYYNNQPLLRSSNDYWPVPTIALTSTRFFRPKVRDGKITIHKLAKAYDNTCQICGEKFSVKDLTIEHVYPKSKHGTTDDTNCLPTCKKCNSQKSCVYPYFDINGKKLDDKIKPISLLFSVSESEYREEWKEFCIFQKK